MKAIGSRKRKAVAGIAAAIALTLACIALANCSAELESPGNGAQAPEQSPEPRPTAPADASSTASASEDAAESVFSGAVEPQSGQLVSPPGETTSQDAASGVSGGDSQPNSPSGETPPTSAPEAPGGDSQKQPVWVVDFEDVWVVDSPEWDESVPVYGYMEVSICNICGADITGDTAAHGKKHMLAGEGSGHHSELVETVVGYETVHHGAEGHWERIESGGHWE